MFTGIVEEVGKICIIKKNEKGARLQIEASKVLEDVKIGDSINVSGCCLTVIEFNQESFSCDLVEETLQRTFFQNLLPGDFVNLERALKYSDRLGGHLVQGHVDSVGQITSYVSSKEGSYWVSVQLSSPLMRYIVQKGSITIDGVSLTVAELGDDYFSFAMISHTASHTTLGKKNKDDLVNIEVDLLAKYIEKLTTPYQL
jgi:riboflavin synthase